MITKGDDFPIHQTSEPIAFAGNGRNFYDRYFFNGYSRDKEVFFAMAFGIYPNLNIKDAAFCLIIDGVQHNLRASAFLGMERLDLSVGPISVEIIEPLEKLRIIVDSNDYNIRADIIFTRRCPIVAEPHYKKCIGPRTQFDYTRMTQNGSYEGWIEVNGRRIEIDASDYVGTRDRSWGVRMVGAADPQPIVPQPEFQLFWLWAPIHFEEFSILFCLSEDGEGQSWNSDMIHIPCNDDEPIQHFQSVKINGYHFKGSTRHLEYAELQGRDADGKQFSMLFKPQYNFYMSGLGYLHPTWGHGMYHGDLEVVCDTFVLDDVDPDDPLSRHIQAMVEVECQYKGKNMKAIGVLEELFIGPHSPSGLGKDPVIRNT